MASPQNERFNMKTNILLTLGAVVLAAFTFSAAATDGLLSPRAAGNQTRVAPRSADAIITVKYVTPASAALLTPRAAGNQARVVAGIEPKAAKCTAIGSPRQVAAAGMAARTSCCGMTLAACPTMATCGK